MYELHQGDCLEIIKEIPTGSIDMILCDLPQVSLVLDKIYRTKDSKDYKSSYKSLVTVTQNKGESFKKIKLVDAIEDIILDICVQ